MEFRRPEMGRLGKEYRKRKGDEEEERPPKHRGLMDEADERRKKLQAMVNVIRTLRAMGLVDDVIWQILESGISPDRNLIREAFRIANV